MGRFFLYKKLMFECTDELWDRVRAYKKDNNIPTFNEAVTQLILDSLTRHESRQVQAFNNNLLKIH